MCRCVALHSLVGNTCIVRHELKQNRKYNALLTRATFPGTNVYSPMWEGPPVRELLEWGQLNALDLLNIGFAMLAKDRYRVIGFYDSR